MTFYNQKKPTLLFLVFSAVLTATLVSNGFGQYPKGSLGKSPRVSQSKSALSKEFELRASFETDAEGFLTGDGFVVTTAGGDARALKMVAEAVNFLSVTELPALLSEAGFGQKVDLICENAFTAQEGKINLILSTPETAEPSLKINRARLDRKIDELFETQKRLPVKERFLISPVSVGAQSASLSLHFRISIKAAQTLYTRLKSSIKPGAERGLPKAVTLFLEERPLPPGVYYETYGAEKHLFLESRRAELLRTQLQKLTGANLLDFRYAYRQMYLVPKKDSSSVAQDLDEKLFYAEQDKEWLSMVTFAYLEIFDEAQNQGKIVLPQTAEINEFHALIPEFFDKSRTGIDEKTPVGKEDILQRTIRKNDSLRARLRELYDRHSFAREALAQMQKTNDARATSLAAQINAQPKIVRDIGSRQVSQTDESKTRRCSETGCLQIPPSFESDGYVYVYDGTAAKFKVSSYKLKIATRLF